jgi:hypothetical protein
VRQRSWRSVSAGSLAGCIGHYSPTVPAAAFARRALQGAPSPSSFLPFVCWALVGLMLASEISRLHDVKSLRACRPATGALGTSSGSDEPTAVQHARAQEPGRGRHAETNSLEGWKATRQNRFWGQSRGECAAALEWSGSGASGKVTNRVPLALSLDDCQSLPKFFEKNL